MLRRDADASDRLPTANAIHEALSGDGLFTVEYGPRDETVRIACPASTQRTHDLGGLSAIGKSGWEIKTVTTRLGWMRRGLAQWCVDALVGELIL
jgi:hypothetical protein